MVPTHTHELITNVCECVYLSVYVYVCVLTKTINNTVKGCFRMSRAKFQSQLLF